MGGPWPVLGSGQALLTRFTDHQWRAPTPPRLPRLPSFLPPQYQSIPVNKSSVGLLFHSPHSYSYFRLLLERAAKCQDLYKVNISPNVTGRVEIVVGGGATFLFSSFSLSERRAADIKGKNDFSASGYSTKSFVSAVFSMIALAWVFAF